MEKFEQQFQDLDVRTSVIDWLIRLIMNNKSSGTPERKKGKGGRKIQKGTL